MKSLLPFFLALLSLAPESFSAVFSQGMAEVGTHVITSREVQISWVVEQALLLQKTEKTEKIDKADKVDRSQWRVQIGDSNFNSELQQVMVESMVRQEAESFSVAQVSPESVHKDSEALLPLLQAWPEWKKWEVSDSELEAVLLRRKTAKQFLKFKTESSGVIVGDEEAKAYFEKNRLKFGSSSFIQFRDTIKEVLAQKQLEEKLKDWFEILRRKYKVRRLNPPAASVEPAKKQ